MRTLCWILALVGLGCGSQASLAPQPTLTTAGPSRTVEAAAPAEETPVPDLRTRKTGTDWPCFLGPAGTSVSTEKGILSPWPRAGLRIVWQTRVGNGYGMPSISLGRLFQFDRHGDHARLSCLKSETGEFLWKFEYPTKYEDEFGFQ